MKSEHAFATFRIFGDNLVPSELTTLLGFEPTLAYAKGEKVRTGPRGALINGRTGVWFVSTDRIVDGATLPDHLRYLLDKVLPGRKKTAELKHFLKAKSLRAVVTCFWNGPAGAKPPTVPSQIVEKFERIGAEIEEDFDSDEALIHQAHVS